MFTVCALNSQTHGKQSIWDKICMLIFCKHQLLKHQLPNWWPLQCSLGVFQFTEMISSKFCYIVEQLPNYSYKVFLKLGRQGVTISPQQLVDKKIYRRNLSHHKSLTEVSSNTHSPSWLHRAVFLTFEWAMVESFLWSFPGKHRIYKNMELTSCTWCSM